MRHGESGAFEQIEPYKFIVHRSVAKCGLPIRGGLARMAAWNWLFKCYAEQDWVRFVEVYGQPIRIGRHASGATAADKRTLYRAVANIASDAAALLPVGMDIEFVSDTVARRSDVYRDLLQYLDAQVAIGVLGQTLTTQPGDSGSYGLGKIHQIVRQDIRRSDSRQLASTLRRDLVIPIVSLNEGPRQAYPRIVIDHSDPADVTAITTALKDLVPLGLRVRADEVRTLLDLSAPGKDDEVLAPPAGPGATDPPSPPPARARSAGGDLSRAQARTAEEADPLPALSARTRATLGPLVDAWAARIRRDLDDDASLDEVRERLDGDADPDTGAFVASLTPALIAAHLAGRFDVAEEARSTTRALATDAGALVALATASFSHARLPFAEQIAFFRSKLDLPTESWTDIWHDAHDRAFVVSGAAHADLVADLRGAVDQAIAEGTTLAAFRKSFDSIVARHGWSYNGGRDWRTRAIYGTNLRTSYAAGRYRQMQDVAAERPFWRYRHSDASEEPRHLHLEWDGLILRHDDPWWDTHYPPNGWGCKCYTETLAPRDLERLGRSGPDTAPPIETRTVTVGTQGPNPRTVTVPVGIDPGWAYAPGRTSAAGGGPAAPPATPAETILAGRRIRQELDAGARAATGLSPASPLYGGEFRRQLRRRLDAERGAGTLPARVSGAGRAQADVHAARLVRDAASVFPRSWVARANRTRLSVQRMPTALQSRLLGDYQRAVPSPWSLQTPGLPAWPVPAGRAVIRTQATRATALHEYTHHLQDALPELDRQFVRLHVRRTTRPDGTRDPILPLRGYGSPGREDDYVDPYFGREYPGPGWPSGPMEVMTRTYETLFTLAFGGVEKLMQNDRELLDFALGALFRYDPP